MKKIFALVLAMMMVMTVLSGCVGTTVVVGDCTCPTGGTAATDPKPTDPKPTEPAGEGALKTGLSVTTTVADSTSAADGKEGEVKYDVTIVAVTVDEAGVIRSCQIDSVPATVKIDGTGAIVSDLTAPVATKNELGEAYGMVAWGGAIAEWDAQVAALCRFAEGKTLEELKNGAVEASGKAPEGSDLASSATIYLGGFVAGIQTAVENAQHLGAQTGDSLKLVTKNSVASSTPATADAAGNVQLDADIAVVTSDAEGKITSCIIDSVQAKIAFDTTGTITTDLTQPIRTKNELGADYGMVAWGGAIAEWNEQAASFASYVTGKTAAEVAGIAVEESTKPADGSDLSSSVTIAIGGFQALIAKAFG